MSSVVSSPHLKHVESRKPVAAKLPSPLAPEKRFRDDCLKRDGYLCLVTKLMDGNHWETMGSPNEQPTAPVEVAHIIPFSYANFSAKEVSFSPTGSTLTACRGC